MKMIRKKIVPVFLCLFLLFSAVTLTACGEGGKNRLLAELYGDAGEKYVLYGSASGVTRVIVTEDGGKKAELVTSGLSSSDQPYGDDGDGEDFGFFLVDLDGDGERDDVVICTDRRTGREKYDYYRRNGDGEYVREKLLSSLEGTDFKSVPGRVKYSIHKIVYHVKTEKGNPPIYTETEKTLYFGWDRDGKFHALEGKAKIYYSETDVYCLATYKKDPASKIFGGDEAERNEDTPSLLIAENELSPEDEIWIEPGKLEEYGEKPFLPVEN